MALFRMSHNDDIVQNWFWELPDHYWIGTMLMNKHTMLPVSGYDTPLAQFAPIPPRPTWWGYDSGTYGTTDFFSENLGATQGPTDYYNTYWSNGYNYGQYNKPFATAMCLGQCGFMCLGVFPVRYIAQSNNPDEFPSSYVRDPNDDDIVYVQTIGSSVGDAGYLVKYNTKTHKVLWSTRNFGSYAFARMQIFAIEGSYLYVLGNVANPTGYGKQVFTYTKYGTSGASSVYYYIQRDTTPYHIKAGWYIAKVHIDTGSFDNVIAVFNPNFTMGDGADCQYLGKAEDGKDLFLVFSTNSDRNFYALQSAGAVADGIDYNYVRRGHYYNKYFGNNNYYFGVSTTGHDHLKDFVRFVPSDNNSRELHYMSPVMTQQVKYMKYDRTSHSIANVPGEVLSTPTKWAPPAQTFYCDNVQSSTGNNIASKPSRPDRTITDSITCYGHWGKLLANAQLPTGAEPTDVRQIWKHVYQGGNQSHVPMTVLNMDGQEMTREDWADTQNVHTAKFYVLYGENGTKFLMVHDSYLFGGSGAPYDNSDTYAKTYIFKFVDANTLKMVFKMNLNCTDLLWIKHNWFVAARRNRIRVYSIDLETGQINLERNINTKSGNNYFSYIHVDDMRNLWFAEAGKDSLQPSQMSSSLYFVNSYTVAKLSMEPEKFIYTYSGTNIETYLKISAIGDYNELIERDVKLTAVGQVVFKDTGTKSITTKTQTGGERLLQIILTGVGEASITMTLA